MIILDTNVISEAFRRPPNRAVIRWLNFQPMNEIYLCAPVLAELRFGIERLVPGRRKHELEKRVDQFEHDVFRDRVLPFDAAAAREFARLNAARQRSGRPIQTMDALIAAIARSQSAAVATRDIEDFAGLDIELINPFEALS